MKKNQIVQVEYTFNIDILNIHKKAKKIITDNSKRKVGVLRDKLEEIREKLSKKNDKITYQSLKDGLHSLSEEIERHEKNYFHDVYCEKVGFLLESYIPYKKDCKKITFGKKSDKNFFTDRDFERIKLIQKYAEEVEKYTEGDITITHIKDQEKDLCSCGVKKSLFEMSECGSLVCPECYIEYNILSTEKSPNDSPQCKSKIDENIKAFSEALNRFEGTQEIELDREKLFGELDGYFEGQQFPKGEEIRKSELNEDGTRGKSNLTMLITALKNTGNSSYYKDYNFIAHIYWNWKLIPFSEYKERILEDYRELLIIYNGMPIKIRQRKSCPPTQHTMFQLINRYVKYSIRRFKISSNVESYNKQVSLFARIDTIRKQKMRL